MNLKSTKKYYKLWVLYIFLQAIIFQTASCYVKHFILEKSPNQFKSKLAQRYCLKQLHHQLRGKKSLEFTNRQCKKVLDRSLSYFFLFFGGTNFCPLPPNPIVLCFPSHPFNPHYNKSNISLHLRFYRQNIFSYSFFVFFYHK